METMHTYVRCPDDGSGSAPAPEVPASSSASSGLRSAADSVADAFSNQLAQAQADLVEARARAAAIEAELTQVRNEAQTTAEARAMEIAGVRKDAAIRTAAVTSGLVDMECLPLLDIASISVDESGNVCGVEEAFEELKEKKPFLFSGAKENSTRVSGTAKLASAPRAKSVSSGSIRDLSEGEYRQSLKKLAPSYARRYN